MVVPAPFNGIVVVYLTWIFVTDWRYGNGLKLCLTWGAPAYWVTRN